MGFFRIPKLGSLFLTFCSYSEKNESPLFCFFRILLRCSPNIPLLSFGFSEELWVIILEYVCFFRVEMVTGKMKPVENISCFSHNCRGNIIAGMFCCFQQLSCAGIPHFFILIYNYLREASIEMLILCAKNAFFLLFWLSFCSIDQFGGIILVRFLCYVNFSLSAFLLVKH